MTDPTSTGKLTGLLGRRDLTRRRANYSKDVVNILDQNGVKGTFFYSKLRYPVYSATGCL